MTGCNRIIDHYPDFSEEMTDNNNNNNNNNNRAYPNKAALRYAALKSLNLQSIFGNTIGFSIHSMNNAIFLDFR